MIGMRTQRRLTASRQPAVVDNIIPADTRLSLNVVLITGQRRRQ